MMTFSSWGTYEVDILFSNWDVETHLEYLLSWWAVAFFALVYHGVRFMVVMVEDVIYTPAGKSTMTESSPLIGDIENGSGSNTDSRDSKYTNDYSSWLASGFPVEGYSPWQRQVLLRSLHAVLAGINYGVALLLMLIAMTFNPGLFIALIFGYSVGDFLFFTKTKSIIQECH